MNDAFSAVATLLAASLGFYGALKAIRYQADLTRHREDRLAADVLRADLERIDQVLSEDANRLGAVVRGMTFEPPQLHRWSEPLITRLASADRVIVADCMELDRELHNLGVMVERVHAVGCASDEARAALRRLRDNAESGEGPFGRLQAAAHVVDAESRVARARDAEQEEIRAMQQHHAAARARISQLLRRLEKISGSPEPPALPIPDGMEVQSWSSTTAPQLEP